MTLRQLAITINDFRIVPRIALASFMLFAGYQCLWFAGLDAPTAEQSAYICALIGASGVYASIYNKSGGIWKDD